MAKQKTSPEPQENEDVYKTSSKLPTWQGQITGLSITDPVELLTIYHDGVRDGTATLHEWQIRANREFARPRPEGHINRLSLRANNGSGKSQMVVAPCAVWLAVAFNRARVVITSSSGTQLDRQTGRAIVSLCNRINDQHGTTLFKCNYRNITFLPTNSTIELYATDDESKAEGYHPHDFGTEFAIIVDEAKSVEPKIYGAISRCNGTTRRLDVSSPGAPVGNFYNICGTNELPPGRFFKFGRWLTMRVTYKECPHLATDEVEEMRERLGENSPLFKSSCLALFSSISENLVMTWDQIGALFKAKVPLIHSARFAGLDLSAGSDENVLSVFEGNKQIALEYFKYSDTTETVKHIKFLISKFGLRSEDVNADDGGVGKAMIDQLHKDGYRVNRIRNEARAVDNTTFGNRGAEMWFSFARLVVEKQIELMKDKQQANQLATRFFIETGRRIILESKTVARSKGHGSPDRADATVLAWCGKTYPIFDSLPSHRPIESKVSLEVLIKQIHAKRYDYSGIDRALKQGVTAIKRDNYAYGNINKILNN